MKSEIEVKEDLQFQQGEWLFERAGWAIMAAVILAAIFGVFGGAGFFNKTSAGDPRSTFWVEYERFGRYKKSMSLKAHLRSINSGVTALSLDRDYLDKFRLQQILPEPEKAESDGQRVKYFFNVAATPEPVVIEMHLEPLQSGMVKGEIQNDRVESLAIRHFVYP